MSTKQIYMRFLNLLQALEVEQSQSIDLDAKKLLEVIAVRFEQQKPLTVTEAIGHHPSQIGSIARNGVHRYGV